MKSGPRPGLQPSLVDSDDNILDQAISLSRARRFSDAERLFKLFLVRRPKHSRALGEFGNLLTQVARYEEADANIRQAIKLGLHSDTTFYNHGLILKYLKRPLDALDAFNKALAINSADAETWNNRGVVFNDLARYGEAIADFDQAISLRLDFPAAFSNKAKSLFLLGRNDEAFDTLDQVLAMRPDRFEVWLVRANACYQLERYDEALDAYQKVLALKPDLTEACLAHSRVLSRLKRHDEALAAYDRVLALDPSLTEAWLGRGIMLGELKRYVEAIVAFNKALAVKPDLVEAWLGCAIACYQLKRYGDALAAYESVLVFKPDFAQAWLGRANTCSQLGRFDDAVVAFDRALALRPDFAEAWCGRGEALQALNRLQEAIVAFREALAKGGDAEAIEFTLASLGAEAAPATAPRRLIAEFFDQYADHFDEHLLGKLKYRGPDLLFDAMVRFLPSRKVDILDLGCGTGLLGARFRSLAGSLTGVDFSSNMLRLARQRQIYDWLVYAELTDFLQTQAKTFDVVIASDVLNYVGDLSRVFQGVRGALRDCGFFGFSVEVSQAQDFTLGPSRRYAHSSAYLRRLAEDYGFVLEAIESQVTRHEGGADSVNYITIMKLLIAPSSPTTEINQ